MENQNKIEEIEVKIAAALKTVYDPEIPVNILDLGLIYDIIVNEDLSVLINMTLTAPNCPVADDILMEVKEKVALIPEVTKVQVELVFEPSWDKSMMSEEALLELGML